MDVIWYHLNQIKSLIGKNFSLNLSFCVASIVLMISHSNAGIEGVLSMVNKNKNESSDENRLDHDKTLLCILAAKLHRLETMSRCYEFEPEKANIRQQWGIIRKILQSKIET